MIKINIKPTTLFSADGFEPKYFLEVIRNWMALSSEVIELFCALSVYYFCVCHVFPTRTTIS